MKIVVDTSVIIAAILDEPEKESIVVLTENASLTAPPSLHWEMGNAFSAMFKRKRISLHQAEMALSVYERIPIRFVDVDLAQALHLSKSTGIYAYDAYMLVCARQQKAPLLTLDAGLREAARRTRIKTLEVAG